MKRLKTQLLLLVFVSVGIFSVLMLSLFYFQYGYANKKWNEYKASVNDRIISLTEDRLKSLMRIILTSSESKIYDMSAIACEVATKIERDFFDVFKADLSQLAEKSVIITDQITKNPQTIKLKLLNASNEKLISEASPNLEISLLQRINTNGDFVRFATNRKTNLGEVATCSYIPNTTSYGNKNTVADTLLSRNCMWTTELFFGDRFFTYYKPILDSTGECVGAVEVAFSQKTLINSINAIIENFFESNSINFHAFDATNENLGEPIIASGNDFGSFFMQKWLDAKNRPFLVDILSELKTSKFYNNDDFGILTNLGKIVEILTSAEHTNTKFIVRAAFLKKLNWMIVLSINCSKLNQSTNSTNNISFDINTLFKKSGLIILIATLVLFITLVKFADKRLRNLEFFWSKLQKTLQLMLNKNIKLDAYEERISGEHQLAQIVKTCSDVNSSLRDHFLESRNIAQDMFHTVDSMIENFKSSERLYALFSSLQESILINLDETYLKLRKAEDSAVILSKSLAKINELEPSIETKHGTIVDIHSRVSKHAESIEADLDDSINMLNNFIIATNNISNTKELLLNLSEQTNLLALNATIEASSENISSGKGFSIVAEEVKELANKTTTAVKVIDTEVSSLKKSSKSFTAKINSLTEKSKESSIILGQLIEANDAQHKLINEWMIQVFQWGEVITPLVSIIKGFITSVEAAYRDIEKTVSHLDHNKQYINAINNDTADLKRILNDINSIILGWEIES